MTTDEEGPVGSLAADKAEIRRLREDLWRTTTSAAEELAEVTERIDRLCEALETLASIGPDAHLHQVRDIARNALKETT